MADIDDIYILLERELKKMETFRFLYGQGNISYESYISLIRSHEKIYMELRKLPVFRKDNEVHYDVSNESDAVEVTEENGTITIMLPRLLPHREKDPLGVRALNALCYMRLQKWWYEHKMPRFDKSVILMEFVFDGKEKKRDYDNYETKAIKDIVTRLFLPDDSPDYCSVFQFSTKGDKAMTKIHLVSPDDFISFIKNYGIAT